MKIRRSGSSYLLLVGIIGLLIGGGWLAYEVFAASFKSQIEERQAKDILPLTGNLNEGVVSDLNKRRFFSKNELSGVESVDYRFKNEPVPAEEKGKETATASASESAGLNLDVARENI